MIKFIFFNLNLSDQKSLLKILKKTMFSSLIMICLVSYGQENLAEDYYADELYIKFVDSYELTWQKKKDLNVSSVDIVREYEASHGIVEVENSFYFVTKAPSLLKILRLKIQNPAMLDDLIEKLSQHELIEYAERIPIDRIIGYNVSTPNDPNYDIQWSMDKLRAVEAHLLEEGIDEIDVAVVDNGVQVDHIDLFGNLEPGWDVGDDDDDPYNPAQNHGTLVTGTVNAITNNSIGIASVGNKIDVIPIKSSIGTSIYINRGYTGIIWAAENGAEIINCSWGSNNFSNNNKTILDNVYDNYNVIIVAGAGNNNNDEPFYPSAYDNVISVAASDMLDEKAFFSNYGPWVDITAPGSSIYTTNLNNGFLLANGTSLSSPIACAVIGLAWSADPSKTREEIIDCVYSSAVPLLWEGSGRGRVDALGAVECVLQPVLSNNDIEGNSTTEVLLYPNPTNSTFELISSLGNEIEQVVIYNVLGEKVQELNGPTGPISINALASGIYQVFIGLDNKQTIVKKLVKI